MQHVVTKSEMGNHKAESPNDTNQHNIQAVVYTFKRVAVVVESCQFFQLKQKNTSVKE